MIFRNCTKNVLLSVLSLLAAAGCAMSTPQPNMDFLIANGARNVQRINLEHPAVTQLNYDVELRYPSMAISQEKLQTLKDRGWRQCARHRSRWEHFGDQAVTPPKLVHQYLTSYAKQGEYLVVAMRYVSALPSADRSESKPDNATQYVYVIHYDLSVEEVRQQIGEEVNACLKSA